MRHATVTPHCALQSKRGGEPVPQDVEVIESKSCVASPGTAPSARKKKAAAASAESFKPRQQYDYSQKLEYLLSLEHCTPIEQEQRRKTYSLKHSVHKSMLCRWEKNAVRTYARAAGSHQLATCRP